MNRRLALILAAGCFGILPLGGCAVPPAVVWGTVGAGLGYAASVNNVASEILQIKKQAPKPDEKPSTKDDNS